MIDVISEIGEQRFVVVITDNASNMKAAWRLVKERYPHISYVGCVAHSLNLIFTDINGVSLSVQKSSIELRTAVDLLKYLLDFLLSQRELFDDYEMKANEKANLQYSDESQRVRRRKRHHNDGSAEEVVHRGRDKLKIETYLPAEQTEWKLEGDDTSIHIIHFTLRDIENKVQMALPLNTIREDRKITFVVIF